MAPLPCGAGTRWRGRTVHTGRLRRQDASTRSSVTDSRWREAQGTPWAGIGLSEGEREYQLGYEFQVGPASAADVRVALEAKRRERVSGAEPKHTLALRSTVRW